MIKQSLSLCFLLWLNSQVFGQYVTVTSPRAERPCAAASAECAAMLGDLAVRNSLELRTLDQAIAYQKRRGWSSWLNADGWNPLGVAFRIARNVVGGGDVAANKLDIAQLVRRRAEVETSLRLQVAQQFAEIEGTERRRQIAQSKLDAHITRVRILAAGYRLGEGSTDEMLSLWSLSEELRGQAAAAEADAQTALSRLEAIVLPVGAKTAQGGF